MPTRRALPRLVDGLRALLQIANRAREVGPELGLHAAEILLEALALTRAELFEQAPDLNLYRLHFGRWPARARLSGCQVEAPAQAGQGID